MQKLITTAFLMAALAMPILKPRPPLPPYPGPTKWPKVPIDCTVQPRPSPAHPGQVNGFRG